MDDASLRERLGRRGRESVLQRFSWRKAAEETLAVYEELLGRPAVEREELAAPAG
jgi:glycosyltransferase involved in cell wall biosynthesis